MERFSSVCLVARDLPRLRAFYEQVLRVKASGDGTFAEFSLPGAQLTLFAEPGLEAMVKGGLSMGALGHSILEFQVQDVDAEYERLRELDALVVKPPTTQPWGLRSVWFRDPEGQLINFFAPVAGARTPWSGKETVSRFFERLLRNYLKMANRW